MHMLTVNMMLQKALNIFTCLRFSYISDYCNHFDESCCSIEKTAYMHNWNFLFLLQHFGGRRKENKKLVVITYIYLFNNVVDSNDDVIHYLPIMLIIHY